MASKVSDKIKETFNETPKAFRWLLLVAAFVVVLILLFLLIGRKRDEAVVMRPGNRDVKLVITPASANFSDTKIGEKAKQIFKINATYDAVIDSVSVQNPVAGFSAKTACKNYNVNKDIPCLVDVTFAPADADVAGDVTLLIEWHDKGDSRETYPQTAKIVIPVSAKNVIVARPAPVAEPEPIVDEPEPDEPIYDELEPDERFVGGDRNIFANETKTGQVEQPRKRAEKCSDFAMPGYSTSGAQIGWIKPNGGRYEFHPFSDKECNNPTGIYNPDTGIITSIDGKGRKIGVDSDHIGYSGDINSVPNLKSRPESTAVSARRSGGGATPAGMGNLKSTFAKSEDQKGFLHLFKKTVDKDALKGSADAAEAVISSRPYDRTFILRQFKPIPATIVSEVRADPSVYGCKTVDGKTTCTGGGIPVRATVDRNVYSDNGRTIIIPTGTLLLGYLKGELPGPYKSIGRMQINWYQFIRPDGVEFNFKNDEQDPYSADSQGRVGVPGYGSTDYVEQMVLPLLTAVIPAAVNMIAPIADTFVNQIDLDNNTVVQSGTVRSSELAKNEVISAWNQVAQKLLVDVLDNTVPPFSIAAGTRITVYSPVDLIATCGEENEGKKCAFAKYNTQTRRKWSDVNHSVSVNSQDASWTGQVRSFNLIQYCKEDSKGVWTIKDNVALAISEAGYDYRTVLAYCQAQNYQAKNQAKYETYYDNKTKTGIQLIDSEGNTLSKGDEGYEKEYNKQVLGLNYAKDADGEETDVIVNPFDKSANTSQPVGSLDCDGAAPDQYGCCPGEVYTDMGDQGFNCCPSGGGDCFPPLELN